MSHAENPTVPGPKLEIKLESIIRCAGANDERSGNLLHAYTACLTVDELCEAALLTIDASAKVRWAIRNRLLRLAGEGIGISNLDRLAHRLLNADLAGPKTRERVDALLSHLYSNLDPPTRQAVLDRWRDRGTRGAGTRWLKAIADDKLLFSAEIVLDYWRASGNGAAAKILAYRAEPALLAEILPELLQGQVEGWIVSKAVLRASFVSEETWGRIRTSLPATYADLCAKTSRVVGEAEALALVLEADVDVRGLAIWAVGQMGLWSVLEQIEAALPDLCEQDYWAILRLGGYTGETEPALPLTPAPNVPE
jgi:hypothetical protein